MAWRYIYHDTISWIKMRRPESYKFKVPLIQPEACIIDSHFTTDNLRRCTRIEICRICFVITSMEASLICTKRKWRDIPPLCSDKCSRSLWYTIACLIDKNSDRKRLPSIPIKKDSISSTSIHIERRIDGPIVLIGMRSYFSYL